MTDPRSPSTSREEDPSTAAGHDQATARTWVDVDLDVLGGNVAALAGMLPGRTDILMTVKANAYGHGLIPVARAAAGVWGFGVASLDEVAALRGAGIERPVVCLMPVVREDAGRAVSLNATCAITDLGLAEALDAAARAAGATVDVHLEVDTGMGRAGVRREEAVALVERLGELSALRLDGIFTHFASADEPDRAFTDRQIERFDALLAALEERGLKPPRVHAANSAAALRFRRAADRTLVRPGIALYGAPGEIARDADEGSWAPDEGSPFTPALSWHARVLAVKTLEAGESVSYHRRYTASGRERIALLGVGYGDGWPYGLSEVGSVLLRGRPVPIRGAVCMDLTMVDATGIPDLAVGEVATLIGRQGAARQTVEDVGRDAGLMSYAVLTGIGPRVRRRYRTRGEDPTA